METPKKKFLRLCPGGFSDPDYLKLERNYKWEAHLLWDELLNADEFDRLLGEEDFEEIVRRAMRVEGRTRTMLSRFEKSALRDALKIPAIAKLFSYGLFDLIYGEDEYRIRFENFVEDLARFPAIQTSPVKWPIATIFPFLADPSIHMYLKPEVTNTAAKVRHFSLNYKPHPNWLTYTRLLDFSKMLRDEVADLQPHDLIDIQSYIWVTEFWERPPEVGDAQPAMTGKTELQHYSDAQTQIASIYRDFEAFWQSSACARTRLFLKGLSSADDKSLRHKLGDFVILYTPLPTTRPSLMIISNYPSWFDQEDSSVALNNLQDVARRIPTVNSYRRHQHAFAKALNRVFDERLCRPDLLDTCVGLNRFWIQLGDFSLADLFQENRADEKKRLVDRCESGTRKIIEILKPHAVALLGAPAQDAIGDGFRKRFPDITFRNCRSPARGGEAILADDLAELIDDVGI